MAWHRRLRYWKFHRRSWTSCCRFKWKYWHAARTANSAQRRWLWRMRCTFLWMRGRFHDWKMSSAIPQAQNHQETTQSSYPIKCQLPEEARVRQRAIRNLRWSAASTREFHLVSHPSQTARWWASSQKMKQELTLLGRYRPSQITRIWEHKWCLPRTFRHQKCRIGRTHCRSRIWPKISKSNQDGQITSRSKYRTSLPHRRVESISSLKWTRNVKVLILRWKMGIPCNWM